MSHEQFQACIQACLECMQACNHCLEACLLEDNPSEMRECIRLDRECADICAFAAQVMSRNSPFAKELGGLCARVCEACAQECEKYDHKHCQACARACRECARACREMAV